MEQGLHFRIRIEQATECADGDVHRYGNFTKVMLEQRFEYCNRVDLYDIATLWRHELPEVDMQKDAEGTIFDKNNARSRQLVEARHFAEGAMTAMKAMGFNCELVIDQTVK